MRKALGVRESAVTSNVLKRFAVKNYAVPQYRN